MDLNDTLFWLISVAAAILAMRTFFARPLPWGWVVVLAGMAALLIAGWFVFPEWAGYAAAAAWASLVLLPALGRKAVFRLANTRRRRAASLLARVVACLHPADGWRETPALVDALVAVQDGRTEQAEQLLAGLQQIDSPLGRAALSLQARHSADWARFLAWLEVDPRRNQLLTDVNLVDVYLQALGETGRRSQMVHEYAWRIGRQTLPHAQMRVAALVGEVDTAQRLAAGPLRSWPQEMRDFWVATARQVAGQADVAAAEFERLAQCSYTLVAQRSAARLRSPLPRLGPDELDSQALSTLDAIRQDVAHESHFAVMTSTAYRRPVVTWLIAAALTVNFLRELPGGSTDVENLVDLGALVIPRTPPREWGWPQSVNGPAFDEWWRPITAAFLHFGPAHFAMNLLALLFLGARLERAWGWWRTLLCYFAATAVSMTITPLLLETFSDEMHILAGASGGIMGLLGGLVGYLLIGRIRRKTPLVHRQLTLLGSFVLLQTVFDLTHEQVSFQAHFLGLTTGILFGLAVGYLRRSTDGVAVR